MSINNEKQNIIKCLLTHTMNTSTYSDSCGLQDWGACLLTGSHWAPRMRESNSYSAHCAVCLLLPYKEQFVGITSHCGISSRILPEQCKTDSGDKPTCRNHLWCELGGRGGCQIICFLGKQYKSLDHTI